MEISFIYICVLSSLRYYGKPSQRFLGFDTSTGSFVQSCSKYIPNKYVTTEENLYRPQSPSTSWGDRDWTLRRFHLLTHIKITTQTQTAIEKTNEISTTEIHTLTALNSG